MRLKKLPISYFLFPISNRQWAIGNRQFSRRAFTLIELMLSIALVLLLILGINYVFKATADAVGAGEAINTMSRDSQAAQPMIFDDFRNIAKNPPCFIISSQIVTQFLNADDAATGSNPYQIVDTSGTTTTIGSAAGNVSPALYNYRDHRCDMVRFLAHGFYNRRSAGTAGATGDTTDILTSPTTGDDAFITIAHAQLPMISNPSQFLPPCNDGTNAGNNVTPTYVNGNPISTLASQRVGAYAADWVLARTITLLKDPNSITYPNAPSNPSVAGTDVYYPMQLNGSQPTQYYQSPSGTPVGPNITPLGYFSPDSNGNATVVQSSRYDLAGITIEQFRRQIQDCLIQWRNAGYVGAQNTPSYLWWNPLVYDTFASEPSGALLLVLETGNPAGGTAPIVPYPYYAVTGTQSYAFGTNGLSVPNLTRPQCNPLIQTPLTSAEVAQMAPYFLQHCSQFIVEYAGDYIQQDNNPADGAGKYGAMTGIGPDGQIDYVIDANGNKRIRWYGMPRSFYNGPNSSDNNIVIRGFDPIGDPAGRMVTTGNNQTAVDLTPFVDVIPLRDYWWMYAAVVNNVTPNSVVIQTPPWEVDVNFDPTPDYANNPQANYMNNAFQTNNTTKPYNNARYTCAWYDNMPAMIRILIKVDDPNNRVKDGPWYEYVFKLK